VLDREGFLQILKIMLNYLDRAYQALGDRTRRGLVERLVQGPATVSALAKGQPMSLPAVMLHLKVLEEAGLVKSQKAGRVRTCEMVPQILTEAERWIGERRQMWEKNLDALGKYLDQGEEK